MCGIIGSVNKPFDNSVLDFLIHRGPDDGEVLNLNVANAVVTLGHRRLAIQDLTSAGHQPMISECGKYYIIFNGEIYNHLDLRNKLPGVNFTGHSDTEIIVNYLAKFGIDSVKDFNGIFGFAFVDLENAKIYIARDRYGVKPIYFYAKDHVLLFGSELRPIKSILKSGLDFEVANLAVLLKLRYNPAPTTLYKDVHKLRSGHVLEYDLQSSHFKISSFISPVAVDSSIDLDTALQRYGELFEQAVKRQLVADVEVGVLLSGGVDSALVAYFAQKHSPKPIKTFTIGFSEDDDSDETIDARESARILGTEHYDIKITDAQFEEVFSECIRIVEEPLGTTSIIPMFFLNKLVASHGLKVVLTGQGADEPLGGYTRYRGESLHSKLPPFVAGLAKPFARFIKNDSIYRAINSIGEKDTIRRWGLIYALFYDDQIYRLIKHHDEQSVSLISHFYQLLNGMDKDTTNAMMSNDLHMNLSDDLLLYTDKISMNFSIEARVPMLDNDLIDFVESLPLSYKINSNQGKYLHKKFAETVLPAEIVYRVKKGFKSPTEKWFKGRKGAMYKKLLTSKSNQFARYFDLDEVGNFFDLHMSGERNFEKQLFTLISIYFWMQID